MPKKRETYEPRAFESERTFLPKKKNGSAIKDTSANIYTSMLLSTAWHNLSSKQKELYLYCKAQYFGESHYKVIRTADGLRIIKLADRPTEKGGSHE